MKFSTDVKRNSEAGGGGIGGSGGSKSLVRLRDVRETDFGLWRVRVFFFFSFFLFFSFLPPAISGEGGRAIGPDTRYNCWVLWAGKEVPCFCFMRWVGDVGWISGWLVV